jgi:Zn-finger nucleic acid-binding protein
MNVAEAVHCSGCGRDLGLEPIARRGFLECSICHIAMSAFDCGPGALHDCARCGAQFVEHAALRDLLERHDSFDIPIARPSAAVGRPPGPVRYLACPVCHAMMNRNNFGAGSGVVVDVCAKHGTWFDPGELPHVLAFVESGGLAKMRRRNAEQAARLARERAAHATIEVMRDLDAPAYAKESIVMDLLGELFKGRD